MSPASERVSPETLKALASFPAATLYEALGKSGGMSPDIRPMIDRPRLCGPAYTIRILGCETVAVLWAVEQAPPGSVIVIDTGGSGVHPVWGGTSSLAARTRGVAGVVTNGLLRDIDEIRDAQFPVYATGVCVQGTLKNHPGWTGVPVSVGGVIVQSGDVVLGDSDGVVVIPAGQADTALAAARKQRDKETARDARIQAGEPLSVVVGLRS
ncbi:MAG: RraA family protein [Betaproteobacteria bacterium]